MITLIAVRHGQADHNVAGVFNTSNDIPSNLTEKGKLQAETTGAALANAGVTHMYASELARAQQTAEIINKHLNVPLRTSPLINEHQSGYEGRSVWIWVIRHVAALGSTSRAYGVNGESLDMSKDRIARFIDEVKQLPDGSVVCMVAHQHTLQALQVILENKNYRYRSVIPKKNAGYLTFKLAPAS